MTTGAAAATREAFVVADLGYGDAGKGAVTDFLVRDRHVHTVVRYSGGAQAGHNVVTPDGRHHTFSQVGSGGFVPGVRTHLSAAVVVHPTALLVEARVLAGKGVPDPLAQITIHEAARVTTPFHQAAGRLKELLRGEDRHGSCGVGVGETVRDALAHTGDAIRARDLALARPELRSRLTRVRERLRDELQASRAELRNLGAPAERELEILEGPAAAEAWMDALLGLPLAPPSHALIVDDAYLAETLRRPGSVVFEGAQGVLLDEWRGFHPFTTWTTCTFEPAASLLQAHGYDGRVTRLGVLRTYAVRHGPGPFPSEEPRLAASLPEPHNLDTPWQGPFRRGWLDLVALRYALAVSPADALAVTHLDALERASPFLCCDAYELPCAQGQTPQALFELGTSGEIRAILPPLGEDVERQARLSAALISVTPRLCPFEPERRPGRSTAPDARRRWLARLSSALGVPARLASDGPSAHHTSWIRP